MTITRILSGVLLAVLATAGPAAGQYQMPPYRMPQYSPPGQTAAMVPSVYPTGAVDPVAPPPRPAPSSSSLEGMTSPLPPGPGVQADQLGTLTAPIGATGLPPGAYAVPGYNNAFGCCGPLGRNGPVDYELYMQTGPNIAFGTGSFSDHLNTGWGVGGGGRTLFFNQAGDAAWALDLGLGYVYNRGKNDDFVDVFIRQPLLQSTNSSGQTVATPQADKFTTTRIRGLSRTSFNFAIGRDWWLWGSGMPGAENGWNLRVGTDVGGEWGSAHVDLVPLDNGGANSYSRRQNVFHGLTLGFHSNFEMPVGGWIWFIGSRVQYSYEWMNIVPPLNGDLQNINLMFSTGVRF
jgi:hypothetical protein